MVVASNFQEMTEHKVKKEHGIDLNIIVEQKNKLKCLIFTLDIFLFQ